MASDDNSKILTTLGNGMPVVSRHIPGCPLEVCGIAINAGSRDESPRQQGLAHFVEHTIFKGTKKRKSWAINSRMETVGGELNAYTSKEETFIYTIAPKGCCERAVELLADLVCNPVFPESEIEKEREVVLEELAASLDNPSDCIFDEFEKIAYADTSAAHNILGTPQTIKGFTGNDCRTWVDEMYSPGQMLFFHVGDSKPDRMLRLTEKYFATLQRINKARTLREKVAEQITFNESINHNNHQATCLMGIRIPGLQAPDRAKMALLTNILGGPGANSLLNLQLREKRGWVYSVDASTSLLSNMGLLNIYFGCDPEYLTKCRKAVSNIIARLQNIPFSNRALSLAKRQFLGQITVASVNPVEDILGEARLLLHRLQPLTQDVLRKHLDAIKPIDFQELASAWTDVSTLTIL